MSREVTPILTAQDCIVAMMMAIAISDSNIRTAELVKIQSAVNNLPIFAEYDIDRLNICLLYTSPSPRDRTRTRMPSSA